MMNIILGYSKINMKLINKVMIWITCGNFDLLPHFLPCIFSQKIV